jgi:hypothetical protein
MELTIRKTIIVGKRRFPKARLISLIIVVLVSKVNVHNTVYYMLILISTVFMPLYSNRSTTKYLSKVTFPNEEVLEPIDILN